MQTCSTTKIQLLHKRSMSRASPGADTRCRFAGIFTAAAAVAPAPSGSQGDTSASKSAGVAPACLPAISACVHVCVRACVCVRCCCYNPARCHLAERQSQPTECSGLRVLWSPVLSAPHRPCSSRCAYVSAVGTQQVPALHSLMHNNLMQQLILLCREVATHLQPRDSQAACPGKSCSLGCLCAHADSLSES